MEIDYSLIPEQDQPYLELEAAIYSIIKTLEVLESAFLHDQITDQQGYDEAVNKLLSQYKTAVTSLGPRFQDLIEFTKMHGLETCRLAITKLQTGQMQKSFFEENRKVSVSGLKVAKVTESFINALDAISMGLKAKDQLYPYIEDVQKSLSSFHLPSEFDQNMQSINQWITRLNQMKANEELLEEDTRQLKFDMERAYNSFKNFLNS